MGFHLGWRSWESCEKGQTGKGPPKDCPGKCNYLWVPQGRFLWAKQQRHLGFEVLNPGSQKPPFTTETSPFTTALSRADHSLVHSLTHAFVLLSTDVYQPTSHAGSSAQGTEQLYGRLLSFLGESLRVKSSRALGRHSYSRKCYGPI